MARTKRDEAGRWLPGQSGNPAGINSEHHAAKERVRDILFSCAPDAAEKLKALIESEDEKLAFKVSAYIVDQAIGKAGSDNAEQVSEKRTVELFINGKPIHRLAVHDEDELEIEEADA